MSEDLNPAVVLGSFLGQPALRLRAPDGASATVLLHGGHVVSWIPAGGEEQLYLSPSANYGAGAAIRGGVPVIFPQFNERGPLPRHGLVRTRSWQATESVLRAGHAIGVLRFTDDIATRVHWPYRFELELTVSLAGKELDLELAVTNTGDKPFSFQAALHTYLRCIDPTKLQVEGLQGCDFEDNAPDATHKTGQQWGDVLTLAGPIDRVYRQVNRALTLREIGRKASIAMQGFDDVVIWNPGESGAAKIADLPDDDWQHFLCIEAARIAEPVQLAPGEEWAGMQHLRA
ncbi:D-hexose-6-phosphate mutarotase [Ideonella azotifigens]|uniref:Putative glucose-6-phosphate 1-epimerase n=1 Tax=Ideonella azotifigens TaxID=513160 RepID=A0ABN1KIC9_9BURK|nr:D-hexose-6-phosphate mutarotase [Ideonella azotifigens]MCD2339572.1 D-hexose-6-phosphate mutarotase [Ideonella azotifigens]